MNIDSYKKKKLSELLQDYAAGKGKVSVTPTTGTPQPNTAPRDFSGARSRAQSLVESRQKNATPVISARTSITPAVDGALIPDTSPIDHSSARARAQTIVESREASGTPTETIQTAVPKRDFSGARSRAEEISKSRNISSKEQNYGGTVLTHEQMVASEFNRIIGEMQRVMSHPGSMLSASMSPYYSIYMEQYRENAEKAEANAYARSTGQGGYGSSYAAMAGQQAYRETMEDFADLTPSLVQSKGERLSELLEEYQLAKGIKEELGTDAELIVDSIKETAKIAAGMPNAVSFVGENGLTAYAEQLGILKAGNKISVEEYDEAMTEVSRGMVEKLNNLSKNLETAYSELGYEKDTWNEMDANAKTKAVIEYAAQLRKDRLLMPKQYYEFIKNDAVDTVDSIAEEYLKKRKVKNIEELKSSDKKDILFDIGQIITGLDDEALGSDQKKMLMNELKPIAEKLIEKSNSEGTAMYSIGNGYRYNSLETAIEKMNAPKDIRNSLKELFGFYEEDL